MVKYGIKGWMKKKECRRTKSFVIVIRQKTWRMQLLLCSEFDVNLEKKLEQNSFTYLSEKKWTLFTWWDWCNQSKQACVVDIEVFLLWSISQVKLWWRRRNSDWCNWLCLWLFAVIWMIAKKYWIPAKNRRFCQNLTKSKMAGKKKLNFPSPTRFQFFNLFKYDCCGKLDCYLFIFIFLLVIGFCFLVQLQ